MGEQTPPTDAKDAIDAFADKFAESLNDPNLETYQKIVPILKSIFGKIEGYIEPMYELMQRLDSISTKIQFIQEKQAGLKNLKPFLDKLKKPGFDPGALFS